MSVYQLYSLTKDLEDVEQLFEKEEIDSQEYADTKESFQLIIQDEAQSLIGYIKNISSTKEMLDKEIKRLTEMKTKIDKKEKFIMGEVQEFMTKQGITKIDGNIGKFQISKNPASLKVIDLEKIPDRYINRKITETFNPDKNLIKADLKLGIEIDGVELVQSEKLSIK